MGIGRASKERKGKIMQKKYIIIAEYKHVAPFISCTKYDTIADAQKRVSELEFKDNRVWITPITVYSSGNWVQNVDGQIIVQDFDD